MKKKIAKGIVMLALYNQLLFPICNMVMPIAMKELCKIPDKMEQTTKKYCKLPQEYSTIDYLNLASSIVNNNEIEGNCKHYSNATYEIYHKLIKQNNRKDLENKINFIFGRIKVDQDKHVMIEYINKMGNKLQYETIKNTPKLEPNQIIEYSKLNFNNKEDKIIVFSRTVPNSRIAYPTFKLLTYPGGAIGFAIFSDRF